MAEAPSDTTLEVPSEPTNLSQNIYDKLYPAGFIELFQKVTTAEKPLLLDADFYVKLAEAISVQNWNDTCSIKLWILINSIKAPIAKNTANKWADSQQGLPATFIRRCAPRGAQRMKSIPSHVLVAHGLTMIKRLNHAQLWKIA